MYYVYVLKSINHNRFYTGITDNLSRRLSEHNSGKTKSNSFYRPYKIVYTEEVENRVEAREREKFLKSGSGREFVRKIIMDR